MGCLPALKFGLDRLGNVLESILEVILERGRVLRCDKDVLKLFM